MLNTAVEKRVWQTGGLGDTAFNALFDAFAPIARVELPEAATAKSENPEPGKTTASGKPNAPEQARKDQEQRERERKEREAKRDVVILRVKAGGLPPRDARLSLVREGDVFQPILRRNDRANNFRDVVTTPWSFFVVEKLTVEATECRIYSGRGRS